MRVALSWSVKDRIPFSAVPPADSMVAESFGSHVCAEVADVVSVTEKHSVSWPRSSCVVGRCSSRTPRGSTTCRPRQPSPRQNPPSDGCSRPRAQRLVPATLPPAEQVLARCLARRRLARRRRSRRYRWAAPAAVPVTTAWSMTGARRGRAEMGFRPPVASSRVVDVGVHRDALGASRCRSSRCTWSRTGRTGAEAPDPGHVCATHAGPESTEEVSLRPGDQRLSGCP